MPPSSRGWQHLPLPRPRTSPPHTRSAYSNVSRTFLKKPKNKPRYESSPFAERAPQSQKPARVARPMGEVNVPGLNKPPSRLVLLLNRIPPKYRRDIGTALILAPFLALAWLHFPLQVMHVSGASMAPFFNPNSDLKDGTERNDIILVRISRYMGGRKGRAAEGSDQVEGTDLRRGEIVVFRTPHDFTKLSVKRIVGIPGDRVVPLPGYQGGSDAVVVPYNQLWMEGDVDNRDKSMDSNWYGPICQSLVLGKVIALMEPWPKSINIEEHKSLAKEKGRVQENVVKDAMVDPETLDRSIAYVDGRINRDREMIENDVDGLVLRIKTDEKQRSRALQYYASTTAELAQNNPHTAANARKMNALLEDVLVQAGYELGDLRKAMGQPLEPEHAKLKHQADPPVPELSEKQKKKQRQEGPAAKLLREHQEKIRKDKEDGVPNGLDDSDRQDEWKRQDRIMRETAERITAESAANRAQVEVA